MGRSGSSSHSFSSSEDLCGCTCSSTTTRRNGKATPYSNRAIKTARRITSGKPKGNILSLPDDVISQVYFYLKASDTGGLLDKPRHAFAFALTNTRLFKIFCSQLTTVIPDLESFELNPKHIFSVVSLAGEHLRELHVPKNAWHILPYLPALCPNIEKLSIQEELFSSSPEFFVKSAKLLIPKLQALSIIAPFSETDVPVTRNLLVEGKRPVTALWEIVSELVPSPPDLILKGFSCQFNQFLMPMLYEPPKKLFLQLNDTNAEGIADLISSLQGACANIKEVTVIKGYSEFQLLEHNHVEMFLEEALQLLNIPRENERSKCMKMTVERDFQDLLGSAHPKAVLSVRKFRETFVKEGAQVFAKGLPLLDDYLDQDLSRLEEVYVPELLELNPEWAEHLSSVHLSLVTLHRRIEDFPIIFQNVDVLEVLAGKIHRDMKWELLRSVGEVRIVGCLYDTECKSIVSEMLLSLERLLRHFRGRLVSMRCCPISWIQTCEDTILQRQRREMIDATNVYESRGGDASMVKAWVR